MRKKIKEVLIGLYQKGNLDGLKGICLSDKPVAQATNKIIEIIKESPKRK